MQKYDPALQNIFVLFVVAAEFIIKKNTNLILIKRSFVNQIILGEFFIKVNVYLPLMLIQFPYCLCPQSIE